SFLLLLPSSKAPSGYVGCTLTHRHTLRTRILYRKFKSVKAMSALLAMLLFCLACSRLQPLTSDGVMGAEAKWKAHQPDAYHMVIKISGDRIETGRFDVKVLRGQVITLR